MTLLEAEDNSVLDVLSVGMQNSALVLKDEDGDSVTDLAEFSNSNESGLTPAAINIENSSDVIIGPVTQFHGPVTIYQNVNGSPTPNAENEPIENGQNGKLVKSDSTSSDGPHPTDKSSKPEPHFKHLKYIAIFLFVLVIVAVITTVAILFSSKNESLIKPDVNDYTDNDMPVTVNPGPGPGALIEKKLWGGYPPRNVTPLRHPTPLVIISHTATPMCMDFISCIKRVQNTQSYHVSKGYDDISYNFLIGGDGNAYVGRGWDAKNAQRNNSIGICFIGNYVFHKPTPEMIDVAQKLIKEGVKEGKLAENYKLIGHNQTFNTESPGINLYNEIKTWPHFDSRLYFDPPKKVGGS